MAKPWTMKQVIYDGLCETWESTNEGRGYSEVLTALESYIKNRARAEAKGQPMPAKDKPTDLIEDIRAKAAKEAAFWEEQLSQPGANQSNRVLLDKYNYLKTKDDYPEITKDLDVDSMDLKTLKETYYRIQSEMFAKVEEYAMQSLQEQTYPSPEELSQSINSFSDPNTQTVHNQWSLKNDFTDPDVVASRKDLRMQLTQKMLHQARQERESIKARELYAKVYTIEKKMSGKEGKLYEYRESQLYLENLYGYEISEESIERAVLDNALNKSGFANKTPEEIQQLAKEKYDLYKNAVKTLENDDLDAFAATEWTDEKIVENYELINKINNIGFLMNDLSGQMFRLVGNSYQNIPLDPELEAYFIKNMQAFSKAQELMNRISYIQNPYYDTVDLQSESTQKTLQGEIMDHRFGNPALSATEVQAEQNAKINRIDEAVDKMAKEITAAGRLDARGMDRFVIQKIQLADVYTTFSSNEYKDFATNFNFVKNAMKMMGVDPARIRIGGVSGINNQNGDTDVTEGWYRPHNAGQLQDAIYNAFVALKNNTTKSVEFFNKDNPSTKLSVPTALLLDKKLQERILDAVKPENLYKRDPIPKKPGFFASAKAQEQYKMDKSIYDLRKNYKEHYQNVILKDKVEPDAHHFDKYSAEQYKAGFKDLMTALTATVNGPKSFSDEFNNLNVNLQSACAKLEALQGIEKADEKLRNIMSEVIEACDAYEEHCMQEPRSGSRRETRMQLTGAIRDFADRYLKGQERPLDTMKTELADKVVRSVIVTSTLEGKQTMADRLSANQELFAQSIANNPAFVKSMTGKSVIEMAKLMTMPPMEFNKTVEKQGINLSQPNAVAKIEATMVQEAPQAAPVQEVNQGQMLM